jgi:predicted 3-demethylubiquinone-9 3-methyltransferase (glyoxalase superfamily)
MSKVTPFLWFDNNAEEAMQLYTSIFKDSKVHSTSPGPNGTIMSATFELNGQQFMVLNAGPVFKFNEAVSFFIDCDTQAEVDYYWNALTADGGEEGRCGWLKDKFGLSWQVVPKLLSQLLSDPNPAKSQAALQAMLQMNKIDSAALQAAYDAA